MQRNPSIGGTQLFLAAVLVALLSLDGPAGAQVKTAFDLGATPEHKVEAAAETHLPIRLKPGKYQVVELSGEFGHATVDDTPANVTVVPYSHNSAALYPKGEGASHVTIYGKDGAVLMARYVMVAAPEQRYIRLHEVCRPGTGPACDKTIVYYCPNFCYETHVISPPREAAK